MSDWTFHEGDLDREDVRALLALHFAAMRDASPPEVCHVLPIDALIGPEIRFFSLREDGILLGVGALKLLGSGHGEIKSMRTADAALGRGIGGAMLAHLTRTAREMGITRLCLETGSTPEFAAANHLYVREGFNDCGPFGDYPPSDWTLFYSREI